MLAGEPGNIPALAWRGDYKVMLGDVQVCRSPCLTNEQLVQQDLMGCTAARKGGQLTARVLFQWPCTVN